MSERDRKPVRRLPPGPHGLSSELVKRNQRERLIAAMAEACGERGYAQSSVAEIAKRAGVSTASFYHQFKDRRDCMLASFEELFGRLLEGIERACAEESGQGDKARAVARAAAELLSGDPPTARLLSVEIVACGEWGVRAQQEAIERLAALLRGGGEPPLPDLAWALAAAIFVRMGKRAAEGATPTVAELEALVGQL